MTDSAGRPAISARRLAYGVVAGRDLRIWASGPDGAALDLSSTAGRGEARAGMAVVVGPRYADPVEVTAALAGLAAIVARGGELAAGAGVDLGQGLRSGRLDGGPGDRRDAVLAALRAVGSDGAARVGDRAGVLIALFGEGATRRVGAAATAALHDGRWEALHLASAASDLLGPEQLERVLALPAESGEPYGLASALSADLATVLEPYPRPRRLALLLDLWSVVAAQRADEARRRRLRALKGSDEQLAEVRIAYQTLVDEEVVADVLGGEPDVRPAQLVRALPGLRAWRSWLLRVMADALAATALIRVAIAVAEDGVADGIARTRQLLAPELVVMTRRQRAAARRALDAGGVASRPHVYLRELSELLGQRTVLSETTVAHVRQRLGLARDYGIVVLDEVQELLEATSVYGVDFTAAWQHPTLPLWRQMVGYPPGRPPQTWEQPVLNGPLDEDQPAREPASLADRLRAAPDANPGDIEHPGDLLWYAELADAIAQIDGHDAADVEFGVAYPHIALDPPAPEPDPMRPAGDSVEQAVTGSATLVALGAQAPEKPRTWTELVDGLMASTVVVKALTGAFAVPRVVLDRDRTMLPPADARDQVRIEVARDPHQLVDWARFMGNCISQPYYLGEALRGRTVLVALRHPGGRLVANVALRPHRTGWRIDEVRARFNDDPPQALEERLAAWVATLPALPEKARRGPAPTPRRGHDHRHTGPTRANRDLAQVREALVPLAARAMAGESVQSALAVLGQVAATIGTPAQDGLAGVTALRRLRRDLTDALVHQCLSEGIGLLSLWRATAVRPLATALSELDPGLRARTGQLDLLLGDEPLTALPRRLARVPAIAQARTVEVVERRLRRSLGRLACADDSVLAALVPRQTDAGLLCALVLAVSTAAARPVEALIEVTAEGQREVPGFPHSTVDDPDGPWQAARTDALELGARLPRGPFTPALSVPASWLGRGAWPALWSRAHRPR